MKHVVEYGKFAIRVGGSLRNSDLPETILTLMK